MLIDMIPKIKSDSKFVADSMVNGYNLECPDRMGFLYASLSEDRKTLYANLDYQGRQYVLFENSCIGLGQNASIDQYFRKYLLNAIQDSLMIMYE
jgi:hypothetical protein